MNGVQIGLLTFSVMLGMMFFRVPIGVAMLFSGAGAYVYLTGSSFTPLLNFFKNLAYARLSNYDLVVIPLFLLMGQFATHGNLSRGLFRFITSCVGHRRGGVAMAAIGACGAFGAICGSSLATAATMGQVALPELRRLKYSGALATGALAAGGTLGIMIPPSIPLVIYAILVGESIGKLFMAAVIPGVIAMVGYMVVVKVMVTLNPSSGPAGPRVAWGPRFRSFVQVLPILLVFVIVVGGIYGGWTTPTEAAAIGAAAAGVIAVAGGMRMPGVISSVLGTAAGSAMILLVLLGADMLNTTLALTQMPAALATWVQGLGMPSLAIVFIVILIYLFLGCVMESMSMIMLTVPMFYPMIMGLDIMGMPQADKSIWFGIICLTVVEVGLIHPPVGMNVYLINRLAGDVPLMETFRGVVPFLISDGLRTVLLVTVPSLSLFLVHRFS